MSQSNETKLDNLVYTANDKVDDLRIFAMSLIEEIKELEGKIDALESENDELRDRIRELE